MAPDKRLHVLVVGAGVAGLETALALRHLAGDRVQVDVLAPQPELHYWPLLVAEPFGGGGGGETIDLEPLLAHFAIRYRRGVLVSVDATTKTVGLAGGEEISFDALVVACGATHSEAVPGALTFPGLGAIGELRALLDDVGRGAVRSVAFALLSGAGWPLPIYELALMTAAEVGRLGARTRVLLVTPESEPLGLFGVTASKAVRGLLDGRGVELVTQTYPVAVEHGGLTVRPGGLLAVDRVVALARLEGRELGGLPRDSNGFIPVDEYGAVIGLRGVYAAGDTTAFPLKQGGIATEQALTVAEAIAARAGAAVTPHPFRPVLRGLLLTGGAPRYLRSELTGGYGATSVVSEDALWWPPAKIAGRYLAPALSALSELPVPHMPEDEEASIPVEVELSGDARSGPAQR